MGTLSVLLCSEGTYPFYQGGVSVWCHQLVRELQDVDFRVFAITHSPNGKPRFEVLRNVLGIDELPLWGTDEPGQPIRSFSEVYKKKARTTNDVIRNKFVDTFSQLVTCILQDQNPETLASAFLTLHLYFRHFDFAKTMSSSEAWEIFIQVLHGSALSPSVTLYDATTCMRWLQRFLGVLTVQLTDTNLTHSSMAGLAGIPGVLAKLLKGTPFLLTEHGIFLRELYLSLRHSGYTETCRRFLLAFHGAVVKMNYHFADRVTVLGSFNKRWQMKLGASESKIFITPNGVDASVFTIPVKKAGERLVVLTMARIYHLKGIEYLLRAAAQVRLRIPSILFRIFGEVADPTYHQNCLDLIAELRLQDNVEFGTTQDIASAYANADVFCLPSISEGMPYSILEAMFSSCPIVATDVGNVAEMLGATGLVVRPADADGLAKALLSYLDGGEDARIYRSGLARSALERATSLYTTEKATDTFRQLYRVLHHEKQTPELYLTAAR
jgi:polysaccharide biosynthesis protein PelF